MGKEVNNCRKGIGGRPSLYENKYCQEIIEYFSENENATISKFAKHINTYSSTIYEWEKNYPEFSEAKKKAFTNKRENLVSMIQDIVITEGGTKVNSVPLILLARNYGLKTSDNPPPQKEDEKENEFSDAIDGNKS